ncbi:DUF1214 domain-containing protein [Pseudochelatococcus sp. B33]
MRTVLLILAALAIAAVTGLGSAYYLTAGAPPFGEVRAGPWAAWPQIGAAALDPYARAIVAREGSLPLGAGEGLAFHATQDSEGRRLRGACLYRVNGGVPVSRAWTLTVFDAAGNLPANATGRNGFTSHEILRAPDGTVDIVLSREVQPGNWLMLPATDDVHLVLRLYGTSVSAMTGAVEVGSLPRIDRLACP